MIAALALGLAPIACQAGARLTDDVKKISSPKRPARANMHAIAHRSSTKNTKLALIALLDTPAAGENIGSVQYKKSSTPTTLRRVNEKIITSSGGTSATLTVFDELDDEKVTGQYNLITAGANIGNPTYKKHKSKKQYKLIDDQDASTGDGCTWN